MKKNKGLMYQQGGPIPKDDPRRGNPDIGIPVFQSELQTDPSYNSVRDQARLYNYKQRADSALATKDPTLWKRNQDIINAGNTYERRNQLADSLQTAKAYPYSLSTEDQQTLFKDKYEDFNKLRTNKFQARNVAVAGTGEQSVPIQDTAYALRNSTAITPSYTSAGYVTDTGKKQWWQHADVSYDTTSNKYNYKFGEPKIYNKSRGGLLYGNLQVSH